MKTNKKFINSRSKNKILIDKIEVNHKVFVHLGDDFIPPPYKTKSKFVCGHILCNLIYEEKGLRLRFNTTHNINLLLRDYYLKKFKLVRLGTLQNHGLNFIPHNLRIKLQEHNISHSKLLKRGISLLYKEINNHHQVITDDFSTKHNLPNPSTGVTDDKLGGVTPPISRDLSIRYAEVSLDIETPLSIELATRSSFTDCIAIRTSNNSKKKFDKFGTATPFIDADLKNTTEGIQYVGTYGDGSFIKVYKKEEGITKNLNRVEKVYKDYEHFRGITKTRFKDKSELKNIIGSLKAHTYEVFYEMFDTEEVYTKEDRLLIIKEYCNQFFPKYSDKAFKDLTTGVQCITSTNKGHSNNYVATKARELNRRGVLIRKVERTRGKYVIDEKWLLGRNCK
jgi:hypothetical protein